MQVTGSWVDGIGWDAMDGRYLIVFFFFDRWDVGSERWGGLNNVGFRINDIPTIYKIFSTGPDIIYTSF